MRMMFGRCICDAPSIHPPPPSASLCHPPRTHDRQYCHRTQWRRPGQVDRHVLSCSWDFRTEVKGLELTNTPAGNFGVLADPIAGKPNSTKCDAKQS